MKTSHLISLTVVALCTFAGAQAQSPPTQIAPRSILTPPPDAPPPKNNPPGPYAVALESAANLPTHTIYRPEDLSSFKGAHKLPIISWGNGACANAGTLFKVFLTQIASHGYFVVSIGPKDAPLPAFAGGPPAPAGTPSGLVAFSKDQQIIDAIDWAVKENSHKGSSYYGRLDVNKIAVMGQSCGGLQAIWASSDPRVKTTVIWNSGTFPETGKTPGANLSLARKSSLDKFHAPVAYFIGGPTDIAYPNAEDDFKRITTVPAFKGNLHVGHGGTYSHPGAGWFGEVGVAWLDWQLKGDRKAAKYFVGANCTLCTNKLWSVEKKNMQ